VKKIRRKNWGTKN